MKLLIITQKIDKDDSVLGFFHGWLLEFAKNFESLIVICLYSGEYDLPSNIKVLSLGKEYGESRFKYLVRFFYYIISERDNYDNVFVHMNHVYVNLGGLLWKLMRKKICLWYNHKMGSFDLNLALMVADKIFYTSPFSYVASKKLDKSAMMSAGIDTNIFNYKNKRVGNKSILYLGRISPVKNIDLLIKAGKILTLEGYDFKISIYGRPVNRDSDIAYNNEIRRQAISMVSEKKIEFFDEVSNYKTPIIFNNHGIFVNMTNSGSLDKAVLEAMACGCLVIVSNKSFKGVLPEQLIFEEGSVESLVESLKYAFMLDKAIRDEIILQEIAYVKRTHSLNALALSIKEAYELL